MSRRGGGNERNTVYVGNLSRGADEKNLEAEFARYGRVSSIWVARNPHGFAFIEFEDRRDAEEAVEALNGKQVDGDFIRVEMKGGGARGPPRRSEYRVSIEGLSSSASWQDLKSFIKKVAEPGYVDIISGEGVAEFETEDDLNRVIDKLDDADFFGKRLRVRRDTSKRDLPGPRPRDDRPRDSGRDYGRDRDYGRGDRDYGRRRDYSPDRRRSRSRSRDRYNDRHDDRRRYDD